MPFIRIFYFEKKEKSCSYQPNDLCFTFLLDINDEKKKVGIMFLPFSTSIFSLFLLPLSLSLSLSIRDQFVIPTCNDKRQLEIEPNMI
jgi:hypothetical protein